MQKAWFVARKLPERINAHNLTLVAAGVAFYTLLAFIPTLIAVVSIYGLISEPQDVERQVDDFASALPDEVEDFIKFQLTSIVEANDTGVSITLAISIAVALWSASGGMAALVTGLHVAPQEQEEPKSFIVKRGKAVFLTLAAVVLLTLVIFIVAVLPGIAADLGTNGRTLLAIVRWPVLLLVMLVGVGALYRWSVSDTRRGRLGIITPGTVAAAILWVIVSAGFGIYTANFSRYAET